MMVYDLKICLPSYLPPLIHIINCCIIESYFSLLWKKAIVKPLTKTTNPKELKELRPIIIPSVVSKVI